MKSLSVKINFDASDKIAQLHGLGPVLANRIVSFREKGIYFSCPNDLTKLKGISLDLAEMLSPFIDWSLPKKQEDMRKPSWAVVSGLFGLMIYFVWIFLFSKANIFVLVKKIQGIENLDIQNVIFIWHGCIDSCSYFVFIITACFSIKGELTIEPTKRRLFGRKIIYFCIVPIIFFLLLRVISILVVNIFILPVGWVGIFSDYKSLTILVCILFALIISFPFVLVLLKPHIASKPTTAVIFDSLYIAVSPILAITGWMTRETRPMWTSLLFLLVGLVVAKWGIDILRGI
jgi:hypothetical protein